MKNESRGTVLASLVEDPSAVVGFANDHRATRTPDNAVAFRDQPHCRDGASGSSQNYSGRDRSRSFLPMAGNSAPKPAR